MDTTSLSYPAFLVSSRHHNQHHLVRSNRLIYTHTRWHSPQGHTGSRVMSLIYGEGRKADIYRQVLVLHTHTHSPASCLESFDQLIYTLRHQLNIYFTAPALSRRQRADRQLRLTKTEPQILGHFVLFLNLGRTKQNEFITHFIWTDFEER